MTPIATKLVVAATACLLLKGPVRMLGAMLNRFKRIPSSAARASAASVTPSAGGSGIAETEDILDAFPRAAAKNKAFTSLGMSGSDKSAKQLFCCSPTAVHEWPAGHSNDVNWQQVADHDVESCSANLASTPSSPRSYKSLQACIQIQQDQALRELAKVTLISAAWSKKLGELKERHLAMLDDKSAAKKQRLVQAEERAKELEHNLEEQQASMKAVRAETEMLRQCSYQVQRELDSCCAELALRARAPGAA